MRESKYGIRNEVLIKIRFTRKEDHEVYLCIFPILVLFLFASFTPKRGRYMRPCAQNSRDNLSQGVAKSGKKRSHN
jgi:hypothetical protein